jgi:flagellar biosynthesis protein FliP
LQACIINDFYSAGRIGIVSAAQTQTNGVPQMPQLPAMPNGINSAANNTLPGTIPSIGDLMTVVDKATADPAGKTKDWSTPLKLVIIFTGLAILPSLLVMMTSFTRIVIVLSFVRRALTTQTIPPNIAIMGLAFLPHNVPLNKSM